MRQPCSFHPSAPQMTAQRDMNRIDSRLCFCVRSTRGSLIDEKKSMGGLVFVIAD